MRSGPLFDLGEPPEEPPYGAHALVWRLARGLHHDHRPDRHEHCLACREPHPCPGRRLAERGLLAAFGEDVRTSDVLRVDAGAWLLRDPYGNSGPGW